MSVVLLFMFYSLLIFLLLFKCLLFYNINFISFFNILIKFPLILNININHLFQSLSRLLIILIIMMMMMWAGISLIILTQFNAVSILTSPMSVVAVIMTPMSGPVLRSNWYWVLTGWMTQCFLILCSLRVSGIREISFIKDWCVFALLFSFFLVEIKFIQLLLH